MQLDAAPSVKFWQLPDDWPGCMMMATLARQTHVCLDVDLVNERVC